MWCGSGSSSRRSSSPVADFGNECFHVRHVSTKETSLSSSLSEQHTLHYSVVGITTHLPRVIGQNVATIPCMVYPLLQLKTRRAVQCRAASRRQPASTATAEVQLAAGGSGGGVRGHVAEAATSSGATPVGVQILAPILFLRYPSMLHDC